MPDTSSDWRPAMEAALAMVRARTVAARFVTVAVVHDSPLPKRLPKERKALALDGGWEGVFVPVESPRYTREWAALHLYPTRYSTS